MASALGRGDGVLQRVGQSDDEPPRSKRSTISRPMSQYKSTRSRFAETAARTRAEAIRVLRSLSHRPWSAGTGGWGAGADIDPSHRADLQLRHLAEQKSSAHASFR